jgi:exonuclease III
MRIAAVNLRAGGNATTIPQIVRLLRDRDADTLVFLEYRDNAAGATLRTELSRWSYEHVAATERHRGNGVCVGSTIPFRATVNPFGLADDEYPNAVLQAAFEDLDVFGVYLPGQDRKRPHLRYLIATAERYNREGLAALCIGDFNSGRNATDIEINVRSGEFRDEFSTADLYGELETLWTEAWAHFHPGTYEYSWYPFRKDPEYVSRGGWRIDKAFVSPAALSRTTSAEYDHRFRADRLTDHSAIIVDVEPASPSRCGECTFKGDRREGHMA